ncbi:MAG: hypothetical protein ACO2PN_11270 [Pyrobaculum sp.]|jgi:hypothetical protein
MSIQVVRTGRYIELQFEGAEIIETRGSADELYGDGTITLTPEEAISLAKELLEAVLEKDEEVKEETA